MTDDDIRAAVARVQALDAATLKGPWTRANRILPMTNWATVYAPDDWTLFSVNCHIGGDIEQFRAEHKWGTPEYRRGPESPAMIADFCAESRTLLPRLAAACESLLAERDRANFLLRNCEMVLQLCWRDLGQWVQFGRYNAEGIVPGSGEDDRPGPLPEPPQRPTTAGVNYTDQNIMAVEECLGWLHKHLGTASPDDPMPEDLQRLVFDWLKANQITEPHKYRWGLFPLGMVNRWVERAKEGEAERDALRSAIADHHRQKADDRCFLDDDRLYAAAGLPPCDRRVGDKAAMLRNCERFLSQRCEGGGWPSYAELEAERAAAHDVLRSLACWLGAGGYNAEVVGAHAFERKIRDGVDALIRVEAERAHGPRISDSEQTSLFRRTIANLTAERDAALARVSQLERDRQGST